MLGGSQSPGVSRARRPRGCRVKSICRRLRPALHAPHGLEGRCCADGVAGEGREILVVAREAPDGAAYLRLVSSAVSRRGTSRKNKASNKQTYNASACPHVVKSPPLKTTDADATASHQPAHAARQRCGIAAVKVPSTPTVP